MVELTFLNRSQFEQYAFTACLTEGSLCKRWAHRAIRLPDPGLDRPQTVGARGLERLLS
jgi:hypothetical protein